jgi:phenylpropionate dioxygenase-like ring-hydroxylating dioxygenase large terminal subunit
MIESEFLRNTWYMAGWASELDGGAFITRRMLDIPVIVFRDSHGAPQALVNRCPHRFAPLSRGKVIGDFIQCGYHGLGFDGSGACVNNPYQTVERRDVSVRSFPVVERDRIIWVWFGEKHRSDPALVPDFSTHIDPTFRFVYGHSEIAANYELVADNLLDLSHVTFIHPSFGGVFWVPEFEMEQQGNRVIAKYRVLSQPASEFSEGFFRAHGKNVNEYDQMTWNAPACMRLDIGFALSDSPDDIKALQPSSHILTPASKDKTWYFWASAGEQAAPITDEAHREALIQAFEREDAPMLQACEASMEGKEFWSMRPAILPYDGAAVRARHILRRLIRDEQPAPVEKASASN